MVTLVAVAGIAAFVVWGGTTRVMEDTGDYRLGAKVLRSGWDTMPDRAPGYALLLLATGAARGATRRWRRCNWPSTAWPSC